jgi:hypothetical protein
VPSSTRSSHRRDGAPRRSFGGCARPQRSVGFTADLLRVAVVRSVVVQIANVRPDDWMFAAVQEHK